MTEISPYSPPFPSGPGSSIEFPFKTISIPASYDLLNCIYYKTNSGNIKITYVRVGSINIPRFENPVDHYILSDYENRKIMDFYIYCYSNNPHSHSELPECLMVRTLDKETRANFDKLVQSDPALKKMMDEQLLLRVNFARIQRGLPPLSSLPKQCSCLLLAFILLTTFFSAAFTLTILI